MIVVDANVLLYAYDSNSGHHARCRDWWTAALNGHEQIGLPWQTVLGFIRIASNPRVFNLPLSAERACRIVSTWLARPQVLILSPGERFWTIFTAQIGSAQIRGPLVSDAALAAISIEHGASLCTADRDFRRFDRLTLIDPRQ
jgi:toxin-antitoxin system PIN domain toxin